MILGAGTGGHDRREPAPTPLRGDVEIHVVDRDDRHVSQPGMFVVLFGPVEVDEIVRPRRRQLHKGIIFHE